MLLPMARLALSAIGQDRPGIVAKVTAVLLRHGVNVEDSQMAILRGHFAMTLILAPPAEVDRAQLAHDLDTAAAELGLEALALRDVEPLTSATPEPTYLVTVYGVDHPGIVHAATRTLAELGVNITDLNTQLVAAGGEQPLYALLMEVAVPRDVPVADVERALAATAELETVDLSLRELEHHEL
jgi:glycine cleavage system transcriptional repressor